MMAFILGVLAGFAAPLLEPHVRGAVERMSLPKVSVSESEFVVLTLLLLLLVAAVVTGGSSSIALLAGAAIGVFGKRLIQLARGRNEE